MSEWPKRTLGELTVNFDSIRVPVKEKDRIKGPYPYYGASGIVDYVDQYLFDGEYLLIAEDGENLRTRNTPVAFMATGKFWVNNHAHIVRGNDQANTRFLMYALAVTDISGYLTGSTMPKLTQSSMNRIPVIAPPLREQQAIACILGTLDDKIELNRRRCRTLEAMARAIFQSWFVDFDPVHYNARQRNSSSRRQHVSSRRRESSGLAQNHPSTGVDGSNPHACVDGSCADARYDGSNPFRLSPEIAALFPDRFEDSPLGPIPAGWRVGTVGENFRIMMGQSPPGETYNETGEGIPFYQGRTDFGFRFPTRRVYCTAPTRLAEPGDTLVSVRAPVGDVNIAMERCAIGRGLASVRHVRGSRSLTYYTMRSLSSHFYSFEAEGTVFGSISKADFAKLPFIEATDAILDAFELVVAPIDDQVEVLERENRTLAALRDTLLPKLISGELRVPDAERIVGRAT